MNKMSQFESTIMSEIVSHDLPVCYEESTLQRANTAVWEHRKKIEENDIDTKHIGRQRMTIVANLRGILGIRGKNNDPGTEKFVLVCSPLSTVHRTFRLIASSC